MGATVIVAIPTVEDKVNRLSSEKIPHMTLAFLGDQLTADELVDVVTYVEHAASQLSPFGLSVDYRGTLGEDSADVIFFDKADWSFPRVASFRHHLLLNTTIKRLYDSLEQYPEFTPHLTLGYPATPAPEDTSEYPGVSFVRFDRIAVWVDDYDGPEFRLEYEKYGREVANLVMDDMSTNELGESVARELFHYGKKGMKWGVTTVDKASQPTLTRERDMRVLNTKDVTVTQRRAGKYVRTRGGQRQKASDDAVKAAAARQKAKKSTTDALTNDELRAANQRMELEQKYAQLSSKTKRRGESFVAQLFQSREAKKTTADFAKRVAAQARTP